MLERGHTRDDSCVAELLGNGSKFLRRATPAQLIHVREEWRIGPQRCEFFEEQRKLELLGRRGRTLAVLRRR